MDFLSTRALSFSLKSVLCRNKNLPFKCEVRCLPLPLRRCPHASASPGSRHPRWVLGSAGTPTPARPPGLSPRGTWGVSSSRSHASFCACVRGRRCAPQPGPLRGACRRNSAGGQLGGARWPPEPRRTVSSRLCAVTRAAVTADGTTQPRWAPRLRPRPGAHPVASQCTRLAG